MQADLTVEDYHKEMEKAMMRVDMIKDLKATMARFLKGLNPNIINVVEL